MNKNAPHPTSSYWNTYLVTKEWHYLKGLVGVALLKEVCVTGVGL